MYKPYNKATADGRELYFLADSWQGDTYAPARIICYDRKSNDNASLVILAETKPGFEYFLVLNDDGTDCYEKQRLFMTTIKREEWGYIWRPPGATGYSIASPFQSEVEAVEHAERNPPGIEYIKAVLIREWEE